MPHGSSEIMVPRSSPQQTKSAPLLNGGDGAATTMASKIFAKTRATRSGSCALNERWYSICLSSLVVASAFLLRPAVEAFGERRERLLDAGRGLDGVHPPERAQHLPRGSRIEDLRRGGGAAQGLRLKPGHGGVDAAQHH